MQLQVLINSSLWLSVGHLLCLLDFVVCDVICCTPLDHISYVSYVLLQSCCATERQQTSVYFSGWMNTLFTRFVNNYPTSHSFMGTEIHYYYFFFIYLSWSLPISWTFPERKNLKEKNLLVDTIEIHQLYRGILFCQEGWQGGVGQGQLTFCHLLNAEVPLGG